MWLFKSDGAGRVFVGMVRAGMPVRTVRVREDPVCLPVRARALVYGQQDRQSAQPIPSRR
jgi:hypothetical protein